MTHKITTESIQETIQILAKKKGLVVISVSGSNAAADAEWLKNHHAESLASEFSFFSEKQKATSLLFCYEEGAATSEKDEKHKQADEMTLAA